jgi:mono/diheme cytochrome c family protein
MFKGLILGIIVGVLLIPIGVYYYFSSGRAPVATKSDPMPFERQLAYAALDAYLDKKPHPEAPVPASEATYLAAAPLYRKNCAVCHGLPDEQPTSIAEGMFPRPPRFFYGDGITDDPAWATYWKAHDGIRMTGMPGFTGRLTDTELWQIAVLVAHADKISPSVKAALTDQSTPSPTNPAPAKK